MSTFVATGSSLPSGRAVTVDINRASTLAAPTGLAVSDVTRSGFRLDVNAPPVGASMIFEISGDSGTTWQVIATISNSYAIASGLITDRPYQIRAHYKQGGIHSLYAFATVRTLP